MARPRSPLGVGVLGALLLLLVALAVLAGSGQAFLFSRRLPARLVNKATGGNSAKPELGLYGNPRHPVHAFPAAAAAPLTRQPLRLASLLGPLKAAATAGGDALAGDDPTATLKSDGLKIELRQFSKFLQSAAWFSWWCQVILNTVAGVILFFTNAFVQPGGVTRNILSNGYVFAAAGLSLGAISVFWTWGYTGVAKRIRRSVLEPPASLAVIRRVVRTAIFVNLLGLLTSLIGAEQFVGTLMARVLTQQGFAPLVVTGPAASSVASPTVQPVDIFVIQANTNILLSHFVSLVTSLILLLRYSKLSGK